MAGATADILLPGLSGEALASWLDVVAELSQKQRGDDFWILPESPTPEGALPFFWRSQRSSDELWIFKDLPEAVEAVRQTFGFVPAASIMIGAGCRGRPSDHILARLAAELLHRQQGAPLFHGLLRHSLDPSAWSTKASQEIAEDFSSNVGALGGRIVAAPIEDEPTYHAVDLAFLKAWTVQPPISGRGRRLRRPDSRPTAGRDDGTVPATDLRQEGDDFGARNRLYPREDEIGDVGTWSSGG